MNAVLERPQQIAEIKIKTNEIIDLAPQILRQRLRMEGNYSIQVDGDTVSRYLNKLSELLGMEITHGPEIQNDAEIINPIHKGFEGIMMMSGASTHAYTWELGNFFSIDVYSCKSYDMSAILEFTKMFFEVTRLRYQPTNSRDGTNNLTFDNNHVEKMAKSNIFDLAPKILRQRTRIEGTYVIDIRKDTLKKYMVELSEFLGMHITHGPVIQNDAEIVSNPIHVGFKGVMMWAESGTHAYTWEKEKFFLIDVYSCSLYNTKMVLEFTRNFFQATTIGYEATHSRNGPNNLTIMPISWIAYMENKKIPYVLVRYFFISFHF